ncbi:MAG: DUF3945 domain-containing protein [Flavobacteriaceae bacterium]|jgi:hypothetical protein|nr:DUF3945 domain-containing protein [Flavobacteriaceae bacterium]
MAEEKVDREGVKAILADEQLTDILLIIDKKNKSVDAVKKIDEKGKVETTPADGSQNDFLHIGHNSDALDIAITAIKNFYSQARDPTEFSILKVPAKVFSGLKNTALLIKELVKSNPDKNAQDFAKEYQVETNSQTKKQETNSINQEKESIMAKQKQTENAATAATAAQNPDTQTQSNYRFNEAMIDWKSIEGFGISREYLKDKGLLDSMLKGYKTPQLIPVSMNLGNAAVIKTDARLSFQQSVNGPVVLAVHGLRQEPQLQRPFLGHIFSEEDKKNLLETGNMGRSVELKNRNNEYHPYLVSIDKMTNEIVATRADKVFIPDKVSGVELTKDEKELLREGKKVFVDGMVSKGGKEFSAEIQINAERRGIEFIFPKNENQNLQIIGGVQLSAKQSQDLSEGKAIFVEDMKRASDGELFSSFIKKDAATDKLAYTRYNPDSPEGAREIYIPKQIGGVELTGDERDTLRRGTPIFLDGMVNRKGEEFSSYIKADTETGRLSYAKTPDGFAQVEKFKIPAEVWGVTLNTTQRAQLQDGKAVLLEGMKGFDGKDFSSYVKVNSNQGKLDYYREDPDKPKASQKNNQRNNQTQGNSQGEDSKAKNTRANKQTQDNPQTEEKKAKKSRGRGM